MDQLQNKLAKCFERVFPDLSAGNIPKATQDSISAWDSIAAITLLNVIEEEFGFPVDFELLPKLDSFDRILSYVKTQAEP